jgi:recombinational DNA repair protein RecT
MNKDDIMNFRDFSQSKGSKYSPWNEENDPELNMWKKTVLKQMVKYLPKNQTIAKAIEIDNLESPVHQGKEIIS